MGSKTQSGALVLLVDPSVETRHWMWRVLSQAFGVLEASNASTARRWVAERPDIDAIIVDDELPDSRGSDLVREFQGRAHPLGNRAIVLGSDVHAGMLARGDVQSIVHKLTGWFSLQEATMRRLRAIAPRVSCVSPGPIDRSRLSLS